MNLKVNLAGVELKNPIIAASGTFGFGKEFSKLIDINQFGAISTKGLTLKPHKGNPSPRIAEVYGGIINSIGLENPGIEHFIENELPFLKQHDIKIIANINGFTKEEFYEITKLIDDSVDLIEVNISCPNVKNGGMSFGTDPNMVYDIIKLVKKAAKVPVIAKLSPNVTSIVDIAKSAQSAGADAISLINTLRAMAIDIKTRKPHIKQIIGGLSGPCVKPIAIRMIYECFNNINIPIIGMGGIMNYKDAIEFFLAGSTCISLGTVNFINPNAILEIKNGIIKYLSDNNFTSIYELRGNIII
ncbi:dihydroorotate dehydrogenase [Caldicellulosiruptoraceae bacterium PP1]